MSTEIKPLDISITEENVKKTVQEFFDKNPKLEWSQKTCAYALAYVMSQVIPLGDAMDERLDFKTLARFLAQESLHGLAGNASQFKQWFYGKDATAKKAVSIDDLAG